MGVTVLHHYNIVTDKIDESVKFYEDIIGLKKGERPELPDPGEWLYLDETPVVHLLQLGEHRGDHTGPIDHVAFQAIDYEGFAKSLKANGQEFEENYIADFDLHQVFLFDPNGVKVEINFIP
jgi:catechol 2,3-dioxygenase-like lactoylglutathione lyase family enzyme